MAPLRQVAFFQPDEDDVHYTDEAVAGMAGKTCKVSIFGVPLSGRIAAVRRHEVMGQKGLWIELEVLP